MFSQLIDLTNSLFSPLSNRVNMPRYSVNPRTGRVRRTIPVSTTTAANTALALPDTQATTSTAVQTANDPATTTWKGKVKRGDNRNLPNVSIAAYVEEDGGAPRLIGSGSTNSKGEIRLSTLEVNSEVLLLFSAPGVVTQQLKVTDPSKPIKVKLLKPPAE